MPPASVTSPSAAAAATAASASAASAATRAFHDLAYATAASSAVSK